MSKDLLPYFKTIFIFYLPSNENQIYNLPLVRQPSFSQLKFLNTALLLTELLDLYHSGHPIYHVFYSNISLQLTKCLQLVLTSQLWLLDPWLNLVGLYRHICKIQTLHGLFYKENCFLEQLCALLCLIRLDFSLQY